MPRLDQILAQDRFDAEHRPVAYEAEIAAAPGSVSDPVHVVIPAIDRSLRVGPCPWTPRPGAALPARGDRALVIFSDTEEPWIVTWWPYA